MGYLVKQNVLLCMNSTCERIARTVDNILHGYALHAVITSGMDGKHGADSFHYKAQALDFRIRDWDINFIKTIADEIREELGSDYDVVLEKHHLHIEHDPKG